MYPKFCRGSLPQSRTYENTVRYFLRTRRFWIFAASNSYNDNEFTMFRHATSPDIDGCELAQPYVFLDSGLDLFVLEPGMELTRTKALHQYFKQGW